MTDLGLLSGQTVPRRVQMKVLDLIGSRKEVFSITEETSVHQAAQYLREKQVRSVGVVDAGGKIVGVISHSDVSDKVAAETSLCEITPTIFPPASTTPTE